MNRIPFSIEYDKDHCIRFTNRYQIILLGNHWLPLFYTSFDRDWDIARVIKEKLRVI